MPEISTGFVLSRSHYFNQLSLIQYFSFASKTLIPTNGSIRPRDRKEEEEVSEGFLPKDLEREEYSGTSNLISENVDIAAGTYPIYTSYFLQAELRILFDPLLIDFLQRTRLHIAHWAPNSIRTILGITEINRRFGT